jgi:hypothetical protein
MNSEDTPNHVKPSYMKNHGIIGKISIMSVARLIITMTNVVVLMKLHGTVNIGNFIKQRLSVVNRK